MNTHFTNIQKAIILLFITLPLHVSSSVTARHALRLSIYRADITTAPTGRLHVRPQHNTYYEIHGKIILL